MSDVTLADKIDTEEMIDKYDEIKNGTFKSLPPRRGVPLLPKQADYVDGDLRVPADDRNDGREYSYLTSTGKEALKLLDEGCTHREIEESGACSQSYVSKNKQRFGFLLEDPVLFSAFVETGAVRVNSSFAYVLTDQHEEYGVVFESANIPDSVVSDFQEATGRRAKLVALKDDDIETVNRYDPNPAKKEQYTDLSELVSEGGVGDTKSEDPLKTDDTSSDGESQDASFNREEWKKMVKVLYKNDRDDLAGKVIDKKL